MLSASEKLMSNLCCPFEECLKVYVWGICLKFSLSVMLYPTSNQLVSPFHVLTCQSNWEWEYRKPWRAFIHMTPISAGRYTKKIGSLSYRNSLQVIKTSIIYYSNYKKGVLGTPVNLAGITSVIFVLLSVSLLGRFHHTSWVVLHFDGF